MLNTSSVGTVHTQFLTIADPEHPLKLQRGGLLPSAVLAYETYGTLNAARDNAILVFHALTGSQHAAGFNLEVQGVDERWSEECHRGWWDDFIGPGKAVDTDRFFVVCVNYLGGCYGSTGPCSINPLSGRPWGGSFPWISMADIVDSQLKVLDHLGIETLHAVMGGSLGGMMAVSLATRYPKRVKRVISLAAGLTVTVLQRILNFEQICAIENDPAMCGGDYYQNEQKPDRGLCLARMIGHKTFVSLETMEQRARSEVRSGNEFGEYQITHAVESYMLHQGKKFVKRFDANTYLTIMGVWQSSDLMRDAGCSSLKELFTGCRDQRYMVFSIDSDVCYYVEEQQHMVRQLSAARVPVRHITVHSEKGHDSFLLEPDLFGPHLRFTLEEE